MNAVDLIIRKRDGGLLSTAEVHAFVAGCLDGSWSDEQIAAMLMAMYLRGLDSGETGALTLAMADSGKRLDLRQIPGIKVDKHSTGGVADTTTLILAPLVAACGVPVMKMSGRGLGFTGGTIDKLESIPGMRTDLTIAEAIAQVKRIGVAVIGQSVELAPADKRLYALRDVTGTVESIPLIAASIMSKKIAAGADAIVLDVKCGKGAFMRDLNAARQLAETMLDIGNRAGRQIVAVISGMDQPLGQRIGNTLEVEEAISVLSGRQQGDLLEVVLILGSQMLRLAGAARTAASARRMLLKALADGKALAKLRQWITAQGGDAAVIDNLGLLPQPTARRVWKAPRSGYLATLDSAGLGHLFVAIGGGREQKDASIDPTAGLIIHARLGDRIEAGQDLVTLQGCDSAKIKDALGHLEPLFGIWSRRSKPEPIIRLVIKNQRRPRRTTKP